MKSKRQKTSGVEFGASLYVRHEAGVALASTIPNKENECVCEWREGESIEINGVQIACIDRGRKYRFQMFTRTCWAHVPIRGHFHNNRAIVDDHKS